MKMKNAECRSEPQVSVIPAKAESRLIEQLGAEANLDSRVRGNDESRGNNAPRKTPPFSFSAGERKIMNHFVVRRALSASTERQTIGSYKQ